MFYQRIFEIFLFIAEGMIFYHYANSLFSPKRKNGLTLFAAIFSYTLLFAVYLLGSGILNTLMMLVINVILFKILFDCNLKTSFFHSGVLVFFMLSTELVSVALTTMVCKVDFSIYNEDETIFILNTVISKMIYFIFCFAFSKVFKRSKGNFGSDSRFWLLMIVPVASLVILTILFNTAINIKLEEQYKISFSVISLLLVVSNIIIFFVYERSIKDAKELLELKTINQRNSIDKTYFEILEKNNEKLKIFTHDMKNHLLHIGSLAHNEEVDNYISDLCGVVLNFGSSAITKNKTLDIIINKYILLCESKNIKISFDSKTSNLAFIEPTDLSALLNNLLDNAVEAAEKTEEKFIEVKFFAKNNSMQVINITNSCNVIPRIKNESFISTKTDTQLHGFGTKSIKKVVEKYNGSIDWTYNEEEKFFRICIIF